MYLFLERSQNPIFSQALEPERSPAGHGFQRGFLPGAHSQTLDGLGSVSYSSPGADVLSEIRGQEQE